MLDEIENTSTITCLIVVPRNQLDEVAVEGDTGLGIEDGGVGVAVQVSGDNFILSVSEYTLERSISSLLDNSLDLVIGSTLLEADGQIDNGDVGGWNTERHASELAVELWDDLSDSLGGTSAAGNDVLSSSTASTPILGRWAIDSLLGSSVGVDSGHETFDDTELIVDDLGKRSKAVGCAGCVGDDLDIGLVGLLVDTHNVHGGISGGSRDDDLLGATLQMCLGLLGGGEDTGGLDNVVCTSLAPWDLGGVSLGVELDNLAIDLQSIVESLDRALELSVGRVVPEHIGGVVGFNERIVDGDDVDVVVLNSIAEDDTTDAAETVDANLCGSHD